MRQKKTYVIVTFGTTTDAMAMERTCSEAGIPGRLIPVPREITAGCGLAWRMTPEAFREHQETLEHLEIRQSGVYTMDL